MEQLIEFMNNHALLVSAFLGVLALLMWNVITDPGGKHAVDPLGATEMINNNDAVVLDVRSMQEYKDGHIINSVNIPLNGLANNLNQLSKHKDKPIVTVCRSGSRSNAALRTLRKNGFENIKNLRGGIMAWQNANLPLQRG